MLKACNLKVELSGIRKEAMEIRTSRKHSFGMKMYRLAKARLAENCRRAALSAIDDRRAVNDMTRSALKKYTDFYMLNAVKQGDYRMIRVIAQLSPYQCLASDYFDSEDAEERTNVWRIQYPSATITWEVDLG